MAERDDIHENRDNRINEGERSDHIGRQLLNGAIKQNVAAAKTQRQNTTSMIGSPEETTNHPIVPEIAIAAVISAVPRIPFVIAKPSEIRV